MSDSNPAKISPTDTDLLAAVAKAQSSVADGSGASKITAAVLTAHPDWVLAEKRVRKVLRVQKDDESTTAPATSSVETEENAVAGPEAPTSANPKKRTRGKTKTKLNQATSGEVPRTTDDRDNEGENSAAPDALYPISQLNQELRVDEWTKKAEVKVFDGTKGKGLVAAEDVAEGEVIWKEDPFIYCPDW